MAVVQQLVVVTMPSGYGSATLSYTQNNVSKTATCTAGNSVTVSADLGRVAITTQQAVCVSYLSTTSGVSATRTGNFNVSVQSPSDGITIVFRSPITASKTVYINTNARKYISSWATNATTSSSPSYTTVSVGTGTQSISTTLYRDNFGTSSSTSYKYWGTFMIKPRNTTAISYGHQYFYFKPSLTNGQLEDTSYFTFGGGASKTLYVRNLTTSTVTFDIQYCTGIVVLDGTVKTPIKNILIEDANSTIEYRELSNQLRVTTDGTNFTDIPISTGYLTTQVTSTSVQATTGTIKETATNYYIASGTTTVPFTFSPRLIQDDYNYRVAIANVTSSTCEVSSVSVDHVAGVINVGFRLRGPNPSSLLKASIKVYTFNE